MFHVNTCDIFVVHLMQKMYTEGVLEQCAKEKMWTYEKGNNKN